MNGGIDRRALIRSAALLPLILATNKSARGCVTKPSPSRAAVVIGVDRPKVAQRLNAAASAAKDVADWLACQGFEVSLNTDEDGQAVRFDGLYTAVSGYVGRNTLKMLVIYFAGHGYADRGGEFWLLSDAPDNPNELIDLQQCRVAAQRLGIPNVVFISDACRSIKADLGTFDAAPRNLFPASSLPDEGYVDLILGSHLGEQTFEARLADSSKHYTSLFTRTFLSAYQDPPEDCVEKIDGVEVLPNRKLMKYLPVLFQQQWDKVPGAYKQNPLLYVPSEDEIFIGAISGTKKPDPSQICKPQQVASLSALANSTVASIESGHGATVAAPLRDFSVATGYDARLAVNSAAVASDTDLADTGFVVKGAKVAKAVAAGAETSIEPTPAGEIVKLRGEVEGGRTLALLFADGSGVLLAILPGYVCTVVADERGVSSVSYLPARGRFPGDAQQLERVRQLQIAAASAASFGVFRVETDEEAYKLADRIRVGKSIDPTLGLYAAYAFDQASRGKLKGVNGQGLVQSVAEFMREDIGFLLFDVAMLAFGARMFSVADNRFAPPCPMLTQGWAYLDALNIEIAEPLRRASAYLQRSLWTTFAPRGMDIVLSAHIIR
jgi:hypothetical protein